MRKIVKKLSKKQKSLLIGLLIGDGTITNHPDFKLSHGEYQKEYLEWKLDLLKQNNIKCSPLKSYVSTCGYNKGKVVYYARLSTTPTIKALRRTVYIPHKQLTRKLLNWLTPQEIAIWYMDDGCININNSSQRSSVQHTIKIATCVDYETVLMIMEYFKEVWNINFRYFPEGSGTYSIASSCEDDCFNFIKIVKPYILQVPSLLYKIRKDFTKEQFIHKQCSEAQDISEYIF